jgi:hypothetical protein
MANWENVKPMEKDKILQSLDKLLKILSRRNKRIKIIENVYR